MCDTTLVEEIEAALYQLRAPTRGHGASILVTMTEDADVGSAMRAADLVLGIYPVRTSHATMRNRRQPRIIRNAYGPGTGIFPVIFHESSQQFFEVAEEIAE